MTKTSTHTHTFPWSMFWGLAFRFPRPSRVGLSVREDTISAFQPVTGSVGRQTDNAGNHPGGCFPSVSNPSDARF